MRVKFHPARNTDRGPRLELIGALVAAALGAALWFAVTGPSTRAGAIASALSAVGSAAAALTALYLSRESLARTDRQLASVRRAMVLGRYPLLLPLHQSVTFPDATGNLAAHPPTQERFQLNPGSSGSYAFLADTNDRFIIPLENAGEGPALRVTGSLWRSDGRWGRLVGPTALSAGSVGIMTARLGAVAQQLPSSFADAIQSIGQPREQPYYWLEVCYVDVFSNRLGALNLFDPRGLGSWQQFEGPAVEVGVARPSST